MDVKNKQQNLGFGTAFATFHEADFKVLSKKNKKLLKNLINRGIDTFVKKEDIFISKGNPNKTVLTSKASGMTSIQYTNTKNPRREKWFINRINELFGKEAQNIKTKIIPNTPEHKLDMDLYKATQKNAVKEGGYVTGAIQDKVYSVLDTQV